MAKVNWINGTIEPPDAGEYYVILEAKQDCFDPMNTTRKLISEGDIEIIDDYWSATERQFQSIGRENPVWRILAWARVLRPDIPSGIAPRVTSYFGVNVKKEGGNEQ